MYRVWILALTIVLTSVLAACSSQDDSPDSRPQGPQALEHEDAGDAAPAVADAPGGEGAPEALREQMNDPERRAALRERMRELRQERGNEADRERAGPAMPGHAEGRRQSTGESEGGGPRRLGRRTHWWNNERVVHDLGLTESQTTRISEAHAEMMAASRQSRQQLAKAAEDLQQALISNDRERIDALVAARVAAVEARARAEADWLRQLLDILDEEQLRTLARERPGLTSALLSPVR